VRVCLVCVWCVWCVVLRMEEGTETESKEANSREDRRRDRKKKRKETKESNSVEKERRGRKDRKKRRYEDDALAGSRTVVLNVGGSRFETTASTLSFERDGRESFFSGLSRSIEGRRMKEEEGGRNPLLLFVDRDPTHFRHVLNYQRGCRALPDDTFVLRQLLEEADFYCLSSFAQSIRERLFQIKEATRS